MQVDHRCFDTGMSHEGLDCADVCAGFEQMSREGMAHRVTGGAFGNPGLADSIPELALHGGFMQVMAGDSSGARVGAKGG